MCGIMNLPKPPSKFTEYSKVLRDKVEILANSSMKAAVEEAVHENEIIIEGSDPSEGERNPRDISAGFDGTWQRRGFKSLNGVVSCTSIDSGKVMDIMVLSKYCLCLDKSNHDENCSANYQGSSGGMEGAGANAIFCRSQEKYNVRYVKYLGDGDTNSFAGVVESKPYGSDCEIQKLECVNHVSKRMGARLRTLRQSKKKK
jgi:hypothetical protein